MTFPDPENPIPPAVLSSDAQPPEESGVPEIYLSPHNLENANAPEDIRTSWGGTELLIFLGFAIVSLVILEVTLQIFLLARFHMTREQIMHFLTTDAAYAVGFQTIWSCILLLFLLSMIRVYHGARFWTSLGWRAVRSRTVPVSTIYAACVFGGISLAMLVSFVSQFAGEKTNLPIQDYFHTRSNIIWLMVFGIAFAPFWEETIFRGYLYPVFARKWGIPAGVLITGVIFGLMHALQLWGGWVQIAMLIFVGIILTFVRARTRSVVASYLVHVSYNTFLFMGFFIGTQGLKHIPPMH
ncbi:MAG: CPBP family intramembrane glutamic endopeptidase [Candidatus Acidiferrales bacterium]